MSAPILDLRDVCVRVGGQRVLESITLQVDRGDFIGIIGPNGAGKSVLLKTIVGLLAVEHGEIRIFGKSPNDAHGLVGYVPQFPTFRTSFPATVLEVVLMGRLARMRIFRPFSSFDRQCALEALEKVHLSDLAASPIGALSGGQLQRVMIARALASDPELLLFDEPTASLDTAIGQDFYEMLDDLSQGRTILLVSHDIGVIGRHVKTIACLNRKLHYHHSKELSGEILEEVYGCPVELIAHGHAHRVLGKHEKVID